jgi:hypothetical protein
MTSYDIPRGNGKELGDILVTLRKHLLDHSRKLCDPYVLQVGDGLQYRVREVLKDLEELHRNGEYIMYAEKEEE